MTSNNDDNGEFISANGVISKTITLIPGTEPVDDGDADSNTNLTLDFGFYQNDAAEGPVSGLCDLSLGNIVWHDADHDGVYQPDRETGTDGVRLNLYEDTNHSGDYTPGEDQFLKTTTTFTPGHYSDIWRRTGQ